MKRQIDTFIIIQILVLIGRFSLHLVQKFVDCWGMCTKNECVISIKDFGKSGAFDGLNLLRCIEPRSYIMKNCGHKEYKKKRWQWASLANARVLVSISGRMSICCDPKLPVIVHLSYQSQHARGCFEASENLQKFSLINLIKSSPSPIILATNLTFSVLICQAIFWIEKWPEKLIFVV